MNQIFDNFAEIDLGSQGSGCESGGNAVVNDGIPCPKITSELVNGSNHVTEIDGQASTNSSVEVWTASNGANDNGRGGSMVYLGTTTATGTTCGGSACPSGTSSWTVDATSNAFANGFVLVAQQPITATATLPVSGASPAQSETSEFAQDFATLSTVDTTVTTNSDSTTPGIPCDTASGSFISSVNLRCAISEANLLPNQTVTFKVPTAQTTIMPNGDLAPLTASGLTIDGYSQSGATPNTNPIGQADNAVIKVQIDGTALGSSSYHSGIRVEGQNETIKGLSITNYSGAGVEVDNGNGLAVTGDFLGLTPSGAPAGNQDGIDTYANYNSSNPGVTIGGTATATRNVISGNSTDGIYLDDYNDTVEGSYIGTNPAGSQAAANGLFGISMDFAQTGTIGGTTPSTDANVISGNGRDGIHVWDGASGNTIEGNFIGTDAAGTQALGNGSGPAPAGFSQPNDGSGIFVDNLTYGGGTTGNTIGPGNFISGNIANGVELYGGSGGDGNNVIGNRIGLSISGAALGNGGSGIYANNGASGDSIGGTASGQGNTIEWNGLSGVKVGASAADGSQVVIERNTIVGNVQNGVVGTDNEITLTGESPSDCTSANVAGAPNDNLPCPSNVSLVGTTASATTCPGCTVDFYTYRVGTHEAVQNHGGGLTWLGSKTASWSCSIGTGGSCVDNTVVVLTVPVGTLGFTTTATDPTVTSEFSANTGGPTAARVAWFHVRRAGGTVRFRWRMAIPSGVAGFDLYAGSRRLNRSLIRLHVQRTYTYTARSGRHSGRYSLRVLLTSGAILRVGSS